MTEDEIECGADGVLAQVREALGLQPGASVTETVKVLVEEHQVLSKGVMTLWRSLTTIWEHGDVKVAKIAIDRSAKVRAIAGATTGEETEEPEPMAIRVYQIEDRFSVSDHEVWVQGVYATESAARRAPGVAVDALSDLWKRVCPKPITDLDLDGLERPDVDYSLERRVDGVTWKAEAVAVVSSEEAATNGDPSDSGPAGDPGF